MYKQISVYIVLLLALIALTFFLTSYYIDSETDQSKKNQNLNIFQAKDINLKLNFFESDIDVTLKSKMINGLSNSKILDIFNPIINIKNSEIEVEIISESSELNYGTEELFIPSKIIFKGMYLNQPFTGEADEMNFYFLENRISFSKNLMLIFDEKEYKGQNIEINTKDKSIMGSDKISINKINDFKNKKDL
jgi:lipopolysaccharide export system protein LptC